MAETFRKTITGSFTCPSSGIVEVVSLEAYNQNSKCILYEGTDETGRRIFDLSTVAWDSKTSPILNVPYSGGLYCVINGTGAGLSVTVR